MFREKKEVDSEIANDLFIFLIVHRNIESETMIADLSTLQVCREGEFAVCNILK